MTFQPRSSFGWAWLVAMGLLMAFLAWLMTAAAATEPAPQPLVFTITVYGIVALGLWFLALAAMFPTMRYEIGEGELRLRYGPMMWRVPLASIRAVTRTDLAWTLWSSMRFPGFALYKVPYGAGVGNVRMCATRCAEGVLLIDADDGKYGVTPADEAAFVAALLGRPAEGGMEGRP